MEPGERPPGQRTAEAVQPGRLDQERGDRPVGALRLESQLGVDVVARERPGETLGALDTTHQQLAARGRPPEEGRPVVTVNLPARALRDAAAVWPDAGDARPPVR